MKHNIAPCSVKNIVSLTKTNSTSVEEQYSRGGIFPGSKYAWLSRGPFLKIVDIVTGERVSSWKFNSSRPEFITKVTCVIELHSSDDTSSLKLTVVGLECDVIGGMLCVFDIQGSRLLRTIHIPGKVMCMSIVDSGSSGCEGRYPLPGLLSSMSGIVAVGVSEGRIFLVDLCRVTCEELLNTWFNDDREVVRDEEYPCQPLFITMDDDEDSDTLEKKRAEAAVTGDHLCLLLNENAYNKDNFILHNHVGETYASFRKQAVGVTSIVYIPRTASLAVGFNFGCFQIWNLMHLSLSYTSHLMQDPLPVVHLGFQEPTDDPCNFCYLWAVHSSNADYPSRSHPFGLMYALAYDSREWVDGYGYLYQDYQSCHHRFEYNFTADFHPDDDVRCVSFHTLSNATQTQKIISEDGYEEGNTENDLSLSVFVWEIYDSEGRPVATSMSLFDINQWYKAQMPRRIEADEVMGYLVIFSLNNLRKKLDELSKPQHVVLDLQIDPFELSQFRAFLPQEEHYYPSALSFASSVLLGNMVGTHAHPGLQRHLLQNMEQKGSQSILHPNSFYKECQVVGLRPVLMESNGHHEPTPGDQREFLLSVALENQLMNLLYNCASDWANGCMSANNCSLPMLLSWGFQRAVALKEAADNLCVPLFNYSGVRLDKNELSLLENCSSQLRRLSSLFEGVLKNNKLSGFLEYENFCERTEELTMVAAYFEVLPWFINGGLLPEVPEGDERFSCFPLRAPYPFTTLTKFYEERRYILKNLNETKGTKASLFVDKMLENESGGVHVVELWKSDGGNGLYPPPSVQSLLAMYLIKGVDIQTKHSIIIYLFLDLANYLDNRVYGKVIDHFIKFPCAFCINTSVIKVTQALWLLDQTRFEDALYMLLDPLISPKDLLPWHHRYIVHVLLSQGEHSKALEYFIVRKLPVHDLEGIKLKISLLVVNKQITQAYTFLQQYQSEENSKELLYHFFEECARARQLGMVMKLMLSPLEEDSFMSFLQHSKVEHTDDMQVTYYLMRARIIEAHAINEKINSVASGKSRAVGHRKDMGSERNVRNLLVEGFTKTLPSVTRDLAKYCTQQKKTLQNWRQVQRPTPLSVDVHYGNSQPVCYKSSLIHATLEKARETWMVSGVPALNSQMREKINLDRDVSSVQNLPFLCTSLDGSRHERDTTPITFPRLANSSMKRQLESDDESSPLKRSRLDTTSSPMRSRYLLNTRKGSMRSAANLSLLSSPLVKRITPLRRGSGRRESSETSLSRSYAERHTPHSILKVRSFRSSISPSSDNGASTFAAGHREGTPSKTTEDARQIRFCLPLQEEIEQAIPLSCSTPENVQDRFKKNIVCSVKPRPSIKSSALTDSSSAEDKSLNTKRKDMFVFGSTAPGKTSLFSTSSDSTRENDSGESFYSAEESSASGDSSLNKYIAKIKQVKSRPYLPRLQETPPKDGAKTNIGLNAAVRKPEHANDEQSDSSSSEEESRTEDHAFVQKSILVDTSEVDITWREKSRRAMPKINDSSDGEEPSASNKEDNVNNTVPEKERTLSWEENGLNRENSIARIKGIKGRKPLARFLADFDSPNSSTASSKSNSFSFGMKGSILLDDTNYELTDVLSANLNESKPAPESTTVGEGEESDDEIEVEPKEEEIVKECERTETENSALSVSFNSSEKPESSESEEEDVNSAAVDLEAAVAPESALERRREEAKDAEKEIEVLEERTSIPGSETISAEADLGEEEKTFAPLTTLSSNQYLSYPDITEQQQQQQCLEPYNSNVPIVGDLQSQQVHGQVYLPPSQTDFGQVTAGRGLYLSPTIHSSAAAGQQEMAQTGIREPHQLYRSTTAPREPYESCITTAPREPYESCITTAPREPYESCTTTTAPREPYESCTIRNEMYHSSMERQEFYRSQMSHHELYQSSEMMLQTSAHQQPAFLPNLVQMERLPAENADPTTVNISSDDSDDIEISAENTAGPLHSLQRTPYSVEVEDVSSGSNSGSTSSSEEVIAVASDSDGDGQRSVIIEGQNVDGVQIVEHDISSNSVTVLESAASGQNEVWDEPQDDNLVLRLPASDGNINISSDNRGDVGKVSLSSSHNDEPNTAASNYDDELAKAVESATEEYQRFEDQKEIEKCDVGGMETNQEQIQSTAAQESEMHQNLEGAASHQSRAIQEEITSEEILVEEPRDLEDSNDVNMNRKVRDRESVAGMQLQSPGLRSQQSSCSISLHGELPQTEDVVSRSKISQEIHANSLQGDVPGDVVSSPLFLSKPKTFRRQPCSIQSEPPQMSDVEEIVVRSPGRKSYQTKKANSLQSEPPEISDVMDVVVPSPGRKSYQTKASSLQSKPPEISDVMDVVVPSPGRKSYQTKKATSLQSEPPEISDVMDVVVPSPGRKSYQTKKATSLQSEPPEISDVMNVVVPSPGRKSYQTRQASSLQSEPPEIDDVTESSGGPRTRQRSKAASLQGDSPLISDFIGMPSQSPGRKSYQTRRATSLQGEPPRMADVTVVDSTSAATFGQSQTRLQKEDMVSPVLGTRQQKKELSKLPKKGPLSVSELAPETQQRTRAGSVESELGEDRKLRRSSRKISRMTSRSRTRGTRVNQQESDSEVDSTQSEPPLLLDVSFAVQKRHGRFRKVPKQSSRKSDYNFKIVPPNLSIVKEEPGEEGESFQADTIHTEGRPIRSLRNRKTSESQSSRAGSATESEPFLLVVQKKQSSDKDSLSSLSSKSTIILEPRRKRKRSDSLSSPENPAKRAVSELRDSTDEGDQRESSEHSKVSKGISGESLEQYTTARRVTRYQKSLMERSMSGTSIVPHELHERESSNEEHSEESEGESGTSFVSNSSYIRSSARLRAKYGSRQSRSPSQSSQRSSAPSTPPRRTKNSMKTGSRVRQSVERDVSQSPTSVYSERSPNRSSPVSSTQRPSPESVQSERSTRSKRGSFQKAQTLLMSPAQKLRTGASSASDAASVSDVDVRNPVVREGKIDDEAGSSSDVESVRSCSSNRSSRSTRSIPKQRSSARKSSKASKKNQGSLLGSESLHLPPIREESSKEGLSKDGETLDNVMTPPNQSPVTMNLFTPFTADELTEAERRRASNVTRRKTKSSVYKKRTTLELSIRKTPT